MSGARCLWRRWCSGHRRVRPPARSPHASLRLGVVDLEARPCPPAPRPCCFVACGTAGVLGAVGPGACVVCLARPGCLVCPWAAARPRAVRAASFARRVASKPGQAPPPAHGHRSLALRRPPHWRCLCRCVWWSFPSKPGQAPPPPMGAAAWPSGPSGALHTGGACVAVCGGASPRSPAKPCRRPWVPQLGYPDPPAPSMPAALVSLCVVELPLEARPGPAAAHGYRS